MASRSISAGRINQSTSGNGDIAPIILDILWNRDLLPPPKQYHHGQNMVQHIKAFQNFISTRSGMNNRTKSLLLLNSLDESIQIQLRVQPGFEEHEDDYEWLKNTLINLFHKKVTETSPIIHLLHVKQKPGQKLSDYLTELRIESYRNWPEASMANKEECLVMAFINGLINRNLAVAIQALKPLTLEAAYKLAEKEYKHAFINENKENPAENYVRTVQNSNLDMCNIQINAIQAETNATVKQLQTQIMQLQNQVRRLESLLNLRNAPVRESYANVVARNYQRTAQNNSTQLQQQKYNKANNTNQIICFNCQAPGHIARFCMQPIICRQCGGKNHTARMCSSLARNNNNIKRPFVRQLQVDEENELINTDNRSSLSEDDQCEINELSNCCVLKVFNSKDTNKQNKPINKAVTNKHPSKAEAEAEAWTEYIYGNRRKPIHVRQTKDKKQTYAQTLISESRTETAHNKPVVFGRCAGKKTKLFLDSGAEMNVVDCDFLNDLIVKQLPAKFTPTSARIQCANGSKMAVTGYATFPLQIGGVKAVQKFLVVKGLFPKIIVGIRTMKTMNIVIDPHSDCIYVGDGMKVPFMSRITPESVVATSVKLDEDNKTGNEPRTL